MRGRGVEIDVRQHDDVVVIAPAMSLDSRSAEEFEKALLDQLGRGATRFAIDLGGVDVVSSAGLRVLIMIDRRLTGAAGRLVLFGLSDHIVTVLEVTGLGDHFTVATTEFEALAALRSAAPAAAGAGVHRRLADLIAEVTAPPDPDPFLPEAALCEPSAATRRALAHRIAAVFEEP
jgi:anti-anti-sigma factor